jgi:hypothetical protein
MWAHLTDGSESSSSPGLLPTPDAYEGSRGGSQHPEKRLADGHSPYLACVVEWTLLPTPRATDGAKGGPNQRGSSGDLMLPSAVMLLPTPTATDSKGSRGHRRDGTPYGSTSGTTLTDATEGLLLPTPTATPYGNNQSPSPGAAARTSLDTLASSGALTPTPSADGNAA